MKTTRFRGNCRTLEAERLEDRTVLSPFFLSNAAARVRTDPIPTSAIVRGADNVDAMHITMQATRSKLQATAVDLALAPGTDAAAVNCRLVHDADHDGSFDGPYDRIVGEARPQNGALHYGFSSRINVSRHRREAFDVQCDIDPGATGSAFGLQLKSVSFQRSSGRPLQARAVDYVLAQPAIYRVLPQGNLFVTESPMPLRSHQYLAGALGDPALSLDFRAEGEDVVVTDITIATVGNRGESVRYLELWPDGATSAVALATVGNCFPNRDGLFFHGEHVRVFCAWMPQNQFVVERDSVRTVHIRPLLYADATLEEIQFALSTDAGTLYPAVQAIGGTSGNRLSRNDGDNLGEGEVFIGVSNPAANTDIVGQSHEVVYAKIAEITNANPDANGTNVPVGTSKRIGEFRVTAANHSNAHDGLDRVRVEAIAFTINSENVIFDAGAFRIYNKNDQTIREACEAWSLDGEALLAGNIMGNFLAVCEISPASPMDREMSPGEQGTFVLQSNILSNQWSSLTGSSLQVSINLAEGHLLWSSVDDGNLMVSYDYLDLVDQVIESTAYDL